MPCRHPSGSMMAALGHSMKQTPHSSHRAGLISKRFFLPLDGISRTFFGTKAATYAVITDFVRHCLPSGGGGAA